MSNVLGELFKTYVSESIYTATVNENPLYEGRIFKLEDYPDIDNWESNLV